MTQLTAVFGHRHTEPYGHPPPKWFHEPTSLLGGGIETVIVLGALLLTASYIAGVVLVTGAKPTGRAVLVAYGVGVLVYLPVPLLAQLLVLPAVAYLGLLRLDGAGDRRRGLRVPGLVPAFAAARAVGLRPRGRRAGHARDPVRRRPADAALLPPHRRRGRRAPRRSLLADLVLSPMLFVGSAILYIDLAAREKPSQ